MLDDSKARVGLLMNPLFPYFIAAFLFLGAVFLGAILTTIPHLQGPNATRAAWRMSKLLLAVLLGYAAWIWAWMEFMR